MLIGFAIVKRIKSRENWVWLLSSREKLLIDSSCTDRMQIGCKQVWVLCRLEPNNRSDADGASIMWFSSVYALQSRVHVNLMISLDFVSFRFSFFFFVSFRSSLFLFFSVHISTYFQCTHHLNQRRPIMRTSQHRKHRAHNTWVFSAKHTQSHMHTYAGENSLTSVATNEKSAIKWKYENLCSSRSNISSRANREEEEVEENYIYTYLNNNYNKSFSLKHRRGQSKNTNHNQF